MTPCSFHGIGICDETGQYYGFSYLTSDHFGDGLDRQNAEARGIGPSLYVFSVALTSRADAATLRVGDEIHEVNGVTAMSP